MRFISYMIQCAKVYIQLTKIEKAARVLQKEQLAKQAKEDEDFQDLILDLNEVMYYVNKNRSFSIGAGCTSNN